VVHGWSDYPTGYQDASQSPVADGGHSLLNEREDMGNQGKCWT
jgi:hypothetical protein